jgi:fatty acid desaturase
MGKQSPRLSTGGGTRVDVATSISLNGRIDRFRILVARSSCHSRPGVTPPHLSKCRADPNTDQHNPPSVPQPQKKPEQEPHAKRRREILEKHPEIKELYGPDWRTMPQIFAVVSAQLGLAYYLGNYASTPVMLLCAYLFGGFATANLFLANHELSHNLAFASPGANRALGLLANLPIGIPFSVAFKKYHLEHHMFQGHDSVDTDIPTKGEARLFSLGGTALKIVWVIGQLFFYAIRPLFLRPKPMGKWDALNLVTQLTFDLAFIKLAGPRAFTYLLASVFLGGGLHPIAGHFISEHYVFAPGQVRGFPKHHVPPVPDCPYSSCEGTITLTIYSYTSQPTDTFFSISGNVLLLRPPQRVRVQRRVPQRTPRLPESPGVEAAPGTRNRPRVLQPPALPHLVDQGYF